MHIEMVQAPHFDSFHHPAGKLGENAGGNDNFVLLSQS